MDALRLLTADCGFFTRAEARAAGYDDRDVARMVRQGHWVRFRRGFYAFADEWSALDPTQKHRVRSSAVLRSLGDAVALSHVSGVIRHGIETWGLPLDKVHVTRLDGAAGRIEGDVVHHEGLVTDEEVMVVNGEKVLPPDRCVLEAGSRAGNEVALCLFDAGLRQKAFTQEQLEARFKELTAWPFMRHLWIPVRMADGRSGSIGESRGRWIFRAIGIPAPELQHEVYDSTGTLVGITDWWWERFGLLGEFDGRVKYGRLLRHGQDPARSSSRRRSARTRSARSGATR
jgi:hypothetical protein